MLMNFTKMLRNSRSVGLAVALIAVATHAQAQAVRGPFEPSLARGPAAAPSRLRAAASNGCIARRSIASTMAARR